MARAHSTALVASRAQRHRFLFHFRDNSPVSWLGVGKQTGGKFHAHGNRYKKIGEEERQQSSRYFHRAACKTPAHTLLIVKYRLSFLHDTIPAKGDFREKTWVLDPDRGISGCSKWSGLL